MPVMNYRKGTGAETSWIIEETSFHEKYTGKCESIFTQGNGYLGLRNSLEERYVDTVRGMFITGTFNKASKEEATELPNVSDIVNMEIELNGERFSMTEDNLKEYSRTLNLYTGETCRNVLWEGKNGNVVQLSFHRFVSYKNVHVIGAYVEIKPVNCDVKATVVSGINAQVTNHGAQHLTEFSKRAFEEKFLQMGMVTTESAVSIAVSTVHKVFQRMRHLRSLMTEEKSTLKFSLSFHRERLQEWRRFQRFIPAEIWSMWHQGKSRKERMSAGMVLII